MGKRDKERTGGHAVTGITWGTIVEEEYGREYYRDIEDACTISDTYFWVYKESGEPPFEVREG